VWWGFAASVIWVLASCYALAGTIGFTSANFMVIAAKQQTAHVALGGAPPWWQFPVAAIGFATISPLTEEVFFRGLLLRAFESNLSRIGANAAQAILFGVIHLPYFWVTSFESALLVTMVPLVALMGLVYGWAAQRAESVVASMVVHTGCNLVFITVVYAWVIPRLALASSQ
jgi:membrane protease YdiL (CAAX protease family)